MHFAVTSEQGPKWDTSRAMRDQEHWSEHVDFINAVADEGFLVLGGPIGGRGSDDDPTAPVGDARLYRAMLIVNAPSEADVATRLEDDPRTVFGLLETRTIERWEVLVGELPSG
jgi:uncharacterized protein YciI